MADDLVIERILVVTAHPDDVDFGAAGSVAVWSEQGIAVSYCIVTDGEAGGSDAKITRAEMAQIRRSEQTAAAQCVGVTDLHFLGHPDGSVQAFAFAAELTGGDEAGVNADAQADESTQPFGPLRVDGRQLIDHCQGGLHSFVRVLLHIGWGIPHGRQTVAVVVDHDAAVVHDLVGQAVEFGLIG